MQYFRLAAVVLLVFAVDWSSNPRGIQFATAAAAPAARQSQTCIHVNTTTHRIVDTQNREMYLHGVNVVVKGPPWLPSLDKFDPFMSFVEKDMQTLQDLGLNAIRLGMMWPGAEPTKGTYNESYFTAVKSIVEKSGQYGIYSLLDMHQDSLADSFCGEGLPAWAVDVGNIPEDHAFPWPIDDPYKPDPKTGFPTSEDCAKHDWPVYQATLAGSVAYQNLYNNSKGLSDSWAAFWAKVAEEFVDSPYILGYELINEPWAGDYDSDLSLLLPTVADKKNLAPVYDLINAAIRKKDSCHSIYFESVTWDELNVGFEHVPGGNEYANRSVLSYHFYIPPSISVDLTFPERQRDLEKLGCAGLLSEFGIGSPNQIMLETMNACDEYLQSWIGWIYKRFIVKTGSGDSIWYPNGTMNMAVVNMLSRTYAQFVAGATKLMKYNPDSKEFTLVYSTTSACASNITEIYLNENLHYKNGFKVTIMPTEAAQWNSPKENTLNIVHNLALSEGTEILVDITAN